MEFKKFWETLKYLGGKFFRPVNILVVMFSINVVGLMSSKIFDCRILNNEPALYTQYIWSRSSCTSLAKFSVNFLSGSYLNNADRETLRYFTPSPSNVMPLNSFSRNFPAGTIYCPSWLIKLNLRFWKSPFVINNKITPPISPRAENIIQSFPVFLKGFSIVTVSFSCIMISYLHPRVRKPLIALRVKRSEDYLT